MFYIGQGISLTGTWMQTIGQSWLVLQLTESGTALGLVISLQFLPVLILGLWGGVVAERFRKRRLLFFTQASAAFLALVLAVLVATDLISLWMVYVLAGSLGLVNAIDNPARQSFVLELVGRKELRNAVSLNATEVNLTRIIGPALAGIIIAVVGLAPCFFINSVSYIGVLACLFLMNAHELQTVEPVKRAKGQLREGLAYVRRTPLLRDTLVMMAIVGTLTYEFVVTLPLLAKYTFGADVNGYALLTSSMSVGAVLGGLFTAHRRNTAPRGLILAAGGFGAAVILVAISPNLLLALAAMVLVGAFSISFVSLCNAILQLESDPRMRSRVMAMWTVAFLGSTPIGSPIIGWISEVAGARWGLAVGGLAALIAGFYGLKAMRNYAVGDVTRDNELGGE